MDLLSDVLRTIRLSGSVLLHAEFASPWQYRSAEAAMLAQLLLPHARRMIQFHYIAAGSCFAQVGPEQVELTAGDTVVLPSGETHVLGFGDAPVEDIACVLPSSPPWDHPPQVRGGGDGDEKTEILCGFLHCDDALFNPLFDALPRIVVARAADGPQASLLNNGLQMLTSELRESRPGGVSIRERLVELLFMEVVRQHASSLATDASGWVAAISDDRIRRALEEIHSHPDREYSVEDLAKHAGMSRSSFYERFTGLLGDSPAQYLARWRMQRAAHLLVDTDDTLINVAGSVGYASEAAFSRAFKRYSGQSPSIWRRERRTVAA